MSALTDIFTALANKIRSKTGTQTTYTPAQMVSDGIDDVYAAGYDAGGGGATGTPITPSNSSPASMTAGTDYEPTANGYAIESYTELDPSNSEPWPTITSGTIYKAVDNGYAIESVNTVTPSNSNPLNLRPHAIYSIDENYREGGYLVQSEPTALTPNNTSPPSIASGTIYKGGGTGNAIASIATNGNGVTPSSSGKYFYSGWNRMTSWGYAYSSQPTTVTTTPLWTNSSPNGTFAAQTITLSSSMANYDEIKITFQGPVVTEYPNTTSYNVFPVSLITASQNANAAFCAILGGYRRTSTQRIRRVTFVSNTQISISLAYMINSNDSGANNMIVPTSVVGIKYN